MTVEFRLNTRKKETDDGFPLVLEVSHRGKRIQKRVAFAKVHEFSIDAGLITPKHPDYGFLMAYMVDIKLRARRLVYEFPNDPEALLAKLFEKERSGLKFAEFGMELLNDMEELAQEYERSGRLLERNRTNGNRLVYKNVLEQFAKVVPGVTFDGLNGEVIERFKQHHRLKGNSRATIHNYLRTLRAIYNKGVQRYNLPNKKPFEGAFDGLKVRARDARKKYLTDAELQKLEHYAGGGRREMFVKLFLLQFYFGGCDLIDLYYLKREQLRRGRVYFERGKTGVLIDLAVHPKAQAVMASLPGDAVYLVTGRRDPLGYRTFRGNYARALKEVQQELNIQVMPVGGLLGSKVIRHTFQNRAKLLGIDPELIRELVGHERDDVDQYYKDKFPAPVRDEALFRVIELPV
jgi:hypothetical protein